MSGSNQGPRRLQGRRIPRRPPPSYDGVTYTSAPTTSTSPPTSPRRNRDAAAAEKWEGEQQQQQRRPGIVRDVMRGSIGSGYGPYSFDPDVNRPRRVKRSDGPKQPLARSETVSAKWGRNIDQDDMLHNRLPESKSREYFSDRFAMVFSLRGWSNLLAFLTISGALLTLFLGYPVSIALTSSPPNPHANGGYNMGGINASGQVPALGNSFPSLIDADTPEGAYTYTNPDGKKYDLVFSDEFNTEGRTFYPGDDPYWEAVDLHYWPTEDLEWYDPSAVITHNGNLVITLSNTSTHNLSFQSGMLQSWNKVCFTTAYIEVSVSLPGSSSQVGFWPGLWTMGNLGRAGYGSTTDGTWPYSYAACDLGTFPNQTTAEGQPASSIVDGESISFLPGQRLSACTCPNSDHPGPSNGTGGYIGRGVPELDILEALIFVDADGDDHGQVSQSYQTAPYDAGRWWNNDSTAATVYSANATQLNKYIGNEYQETLSALTFIDSSVYGGDGYARYGVEWYSDPGNRQAGFVSWYAEGKRTWTITADALAPNNVSQVAQRLISEEPMYMIFNLGISPSFQVPDFATLVFPAQLLIDYVRVYQLPGTQNGVTCDPPTRPTEEYINQHANAYSNPNLTTWEQTGYEAPKNGLYDDCW
ncbi:GH16 domain-containing protein [Mycena chlorophos]|uniref:GH16 domain-containing protein n=1 Tax=Mycena chlorophos TaxID=658473 RepID=A0A8H6RYJ1_MYCCL|nr:GH16 domain-containing protein [Mycena chlorophos]